jgi:translation initiation factor 1A
LGEPLGFDRNEEGGEGEDFARVQLPDVRNKEMFAIADSLLGASRIKVVCQDGVSRMGRIPGKMKKRQWIRPGDLVIVKAWDFQADKCDVVFRYTRTQAVNLAKRKLLPESINIFS